MSQEDQSYKPSISIKSARKLLGVNAKNLSDKEIEQIVYSLELVAETIIRNKGSKIQQGLLP